MNTNLKRNVCNIIIMGLLTGASVIHAAPKEDDEQKNPLGCRNQGYQFDLKALRLLPEAAGERNSLYFVFNKLNEPVHLYHMRKEDSPYSMFLNHGVRPRQWAVLSTSEKQLKYICTVGSTKVSYGKIVDCAESIQVCEYVNVKFGLNNRGNYWLVNSNTKNGAVREVVRYGIIPR